MRSRPASIADAEPIARVHVQAWRETYRGLVPDQILDGLSVERRTAQWRSAFADPARPPILHVVEDAEGTVVGFGSAGRARAETLGSDGEITAIYLLDAVKRRGLGRALFGDLLDALASAGFASAGLWVLSENSSARCFYEALGGRLGGTRSEVQQGHVLTEVAYLWPLRRSTS